MNTPLEAGGGRSQALDFTVVSLGLVLHLEGQSDLWLPLLISLAPSLVSPRQSRFSCSLIKGCSANAVPSHTAGGFDLRLENGGGERQLKGY